MAEADALLSGIGKLLMTQLRVETNRTEHKKVFAVRRSLVRIRLDVQFHMRNSHEQQAFETVALGKLVDQEPDYGTSKRALPMRDQSSAKYIRITDFSEYGIAQDHEFMTVDETDPRFVLRPGDLLFARSGATVGKTYLYTGDIGLAMFAGYCIRFRFDTSKVLLNFMFALLILLPFHVALCQSDGEWQRFKTTFNRSYSSYEDEV